METPLIYIAEGTDPRLMDRATPIAALREQRILSRAARMRKAVLHARFAGRNVSLDKVR